MHIIMFLIFGLLSIPLIIIPFVKAIKRNIAYWKQESNQLVALDIAAFDFILDAPLEEQQTSRENRIISWDFPEVWFLGIAPIMGIWLVVAFYGDIKPFGMKYTTSLFVFILIPYFSYWLSRHAKKQLPIFVNILLNYGMLIGCFLYLALFIHYLAPITLMAGGIFPFLAFPLFAPLPAFLYNIREMKEQNIYVQSQIKNKYSWTSWMQLAPKNIFFNSIIFLAIIIGLIAVLNLCGQGPADLMLAFINGRDFLFSTNGGSIF